MPEVKWGRLALGGTCLVGLKYWTKIPQRQPKQDDDANSILIMWKGDSHCASGERRRPSDSTTAVTKAKQYNNKIFPLIC